MRFVEVVLRPERGYFHEFDEVVVAEPRVTAEAVHQMNLLGDDTMVMLYELTGDRSSVDRILERHFEAIAYQTSTVGDNTLVYAHLEPSEIVRELLEIPATHGLIIDFPMVFTPGGGLRVTLVGEEDAIAESMASVPEAVNTGVERAGTYRPGTERLYTQLTDRQQEILEAAMELGYYEEPREATYEDVAHHVGCTATTVGEHLRKVEATVLREVMP